MRAALTLCLMACAASAHAQATLYKCKDANSGQITYSNVRCETQGLQFVGRVEDRITILPSNAPNPVPPQRKDGKGSEADTKPGGAVKPLNPIIDGLTK